MAAYLPTVTPATNTAMPVSQLPDAALIDPSGVADRRPNAVAPNPSCGPTPRQSDGPALTRLNGFGGREEQFRLCARRPRYASPWGRPTRAALLAAAPRPAVGPRSGTAVRRHREWPPPAAPIDRPRPGVLAAPAGVPADAPGRARALPAYPRHVRRRAPGVSLRTPAYRTSLRSTDGSGRLAVVPLCHARWTPGPRAVARAVAPGGPTLTGHTRPLRPDHRRHVARTASGRRRTPDGRGPTDIAWFAALIRGTSPTAPP